jgi:NAD(P)-dependent dehydrogenase (short-subunit alcohol dehydrogenase family)
MPRRARAYFAGMPYHIVQRGNNKEPCFIQPSDYQYYLGLWEECSKLYAVSVHALLFERIEKSDGRIVVVSSLGYKMGLKSIQFEDLNFEKNYSPRNAYNQSELALMMFIYELQRRIRAENKNVQAFVCHPGASRTSLIDTSGSRFDRFVWSIISKTIAQSAEKGAWPEVMCATEDGLRQVAFYGPTKRGETVGPVGEGMLDPIALDKEAATRLWKISEEMTALSWPL